MVRRDEGTPRSAHALRAPVVALFPAIAWAGLIFALSAQPNLRFVPDAGLDFLVRKAGHMAVFGILALLAWRAVGMTTAYRRLWAWALAHSAADLPPAVRHVVVDHLDTLRLCDGARAGTARSYHPGGRTPA